MSSVPMTTTLTVGTRLLASPTTVPSSAWRWPIAATKRTPFSAGDRKTRERLGNPVDTSNLAEDRSGSVYGNILRLPRDRLMVFGHFRSPRPEKGIWVATSDNNGRSWSPPKQVVSAVLFRGICGALCAMVAGTEDRSQQLTNLTGL